MQIEGEGGRRLWNLSWFNEVLPGVKSLAICLRLKKPSTWALQIKDALLLCSPERPSNVYTGSDWARN